MDGWILLIVFQDGAMAGRTMATATLRFHTHDAARDALERAESGGLVAMSWIFSDPEPS